MSVSKDIHITPEEAIAWIKEKKLDAESEAYAYHVRFIEHTRIVMFWLRDKIIAERRAEHAKRMKDQSSAALQSRILKLKLRGF